MRIVSSLHEGDYPLIYSLESSSRPVGYLESEQRVGLAAPSDEKTAESAARNRRKEMQIGQYTQDQLRVIAQLRSRDAVVRGHEAAHVAAGGAYIRGSAQFSYQKGPDGREYAIGGEVQIDTSSERDPQVTVEKMRIVRAAALAPADPSPEDNAVAAAASQIEADALAEIAAQQQKLVAGSYRAGAARFQVPGSRVDLAA